MENRLRKIWAWIRYQIKLWYLSRIPAFWCGFLHPWPIWSHEETAMIFERKHQEKLPLIKAAIDEFLVVIKDES